jgi:hypothetical protein|tara:strand:+ start:1127 stop:1381 length:255 start_codon:yes stop_codon:yes gene_type:complete
MSKHSAQLTNGIVVMAVLTDSKGRVPDGNIPLDIDTFEDAHSIVGSKYDATAEEATEKTLASFTAPSLGKYFDENGVEQDITNP